MKLNKRRRLLLSEGISLLRATAQREGLSLRKTFRRLRKGDEGVRATFLAVGLEREIDIDRLAEILQLLLEFFEKLLPFFAMFL